MVACQAYRIGAVGRPGAPRTPHDLELQHYVWLVEGLVREMSEENWTAIDNLYSAPTSAAENPADARRREIEAFLANAGD